MWLSNVVRDNFTVKLIMLPKLVKHKVKHFKSIISYLKNVKYIYYEYQMHIYTALHVWNFIDANILLKGMTNVQKELIDLSSSIVHFKMGHNLIKCKLGILSRYYVQEVNIGSTTHIIFDL